MIAENFVCTARVARSKYIKGHHEIVVIPYMGLLRLRYLGHIIPKS